MAFDDDLLGYKTSPKSEFFLEALVFFARRRRRIFFLLFKNFFLKSNFNIVKWTFRGVSFQFHFISRFLGSFHEMQQL